MSHYAFESCMFLKLDGSTTKMIEALQTHLALEYEFFETPADIVESAIFEMYARNNGARCHTLSNQPNSDLTPSEADLFLHSRC